MVVFALGFSFVNLRTRERQKKGPNTKAETPGRVGVFSRVNGAFSGLWDRESPGGRGSGLLLDALVDLRADRLEGQKEGGRTTTTTGHAQGARARASVPAGHVGFLILHRTGVCVPDTAC